jgi:hypothetical protein
MVSQLLVHQHGFPMANDRVPERLIEIENLERDNEAAFSNLRSIVAALRGIRKLENDLLNGNDSSASDAVSAKPSKS